MKIQLVAVGKLKEKFWREACNEYLKRLKPYAKVEIVEIPDINPDKAGGVSAACDKEGDKVLVALRDSYAIALAIEGKQRSSNDIARHLDQLMLTGVSDISFIIGGSAGLSSAVYQRADECLSLGTITLPHNIARVVLLEQIYRAFKIVRGEPYHK